MFPQLTASAAFPPHCRFYPSASGYSTVQVDISSCLYEFSSAINNTQAIKTHFLWRKSLKVHPNMRILSFSLPFFLLWNAKGLFITGRSRWSFSMIWRWMVSCQARFEISVCSTLKAIKWLQKTLNRLSLDYVVIFEWCFCLFLCMTAPVPIRFHFMKTTNQTISFSVSWENISHTG